MVTPTTALNALRIDKWLWAARFFKTRSLAAEAVNGGKVHLNGTRVKPAKGIKAGDVLEILRGYDKYTVTVLQLNNKRGPAKEAIMMYQETAESMARREEAARMRKAARPTPHAPRKPSKKSRRQITRFIRKDNF